MGSAGEEVKRLSFFDTVFFEELCDVAGLSGRVAREVNDGAGGDFEEFFDESDVATGARRI